MIAGRFLRANWIWVLAVGAGFLLRLDQLGNQIVGDDEWHSLIYLQNHGYADIATHFGAADFCIPLTLLHKVLYDTIGLSELSVRFLPLAAGLVALVALPWLLRPLIGPLPSQLFALLLALLPLHIYFSRSARPYAVSMLLAVIALLAFGRWLASGDRRHALVYVASAALAPWFHLTVLPFLFAPVGFEIARRIWRPGRTPEPPLRAVAALGATAAVAASVLLGPPLLVDWASLVSKAGDTVYDWDTVREAAPLLSGTLRPSAIAAWFLLAAGGLVILIRRQPSFGWICVVASLAQILAVLVVRPAIGGAGIVFVRYVLPVVPVLLLAVAVALGAWVRARDARSRLREAACVALALAWSASGPLPEISFRPNSFTNHGFYQFDYDMENSYLARDTRPTAIHAFYRTLAALGPNQTVIAEAPFHFEWHKNNFYAYQRVHRQDTIVGEVNGLTAHDSPYFPVTDGHARFRNAIPIRDIPRLRARGVRFVVLHLHVDREIPDWKPYYRLTAMDPVVRFFLKQCHEPYLRDEQLVVFDLTRCHASPGATSRLQDTLNRVAAGSSSPPGYLTRREAGGAQCTLPPCPP